MKTDTSTCATLVLTGGLLAASLLSPAALPAQGAEPVPTDRLDELADTLRSVSGVPGLAVAIATPDGVRVAVAGQADVERDVAVTRRTRFRLASTSKAVTGVLLARLAELGRIDLDRPIGDYLADLPAHLHALTARQLAGHLAGIRGYTEADAAHDREHYRSTAAALEIFVHDPLESVPGQEYRYTTFGYTLLQAVMEAAAGASYEHLLQEHVAGPLGLDSLGRDDPSRDISQRAAFYERSPAGELTAAPFVDPSYKIAGAGLLSDVEDLARLGQALLDDRLLSAGARVQLLSSQRTSSGESTEVGLGWRVGVDPFGRRVVHHEGSMAGARSALLVYPQERMTVAVVSNLTTTPFFVFESAASIAAAAIQSSAAGGSAACLSGGTFAGDAALDGIATTAGLRLEARGKRASGVLELGELPIPIASTLPILDGWCRNEQPVLILAAGPNWGLIPIVLTPGEGTLQGGVELQGGHALELRVDSRPGDRPGGRRAS